MSQNSTKIDTFQEITTEIRIQAYPMQPKKEVVSADGAENSGHEDILSEIEPKVRQQVKIIGRTIFCFRCEGSKEMASHYCACGSFLCALHLAEHSCLVSASMQYNEELLAALA